MGAEPTRATTGAVIYHLGYEMCDLSPEVIVPGGGGEK
jgi:hypothetical protein